jgi:uncharacterized protein (DUF2141 family)
MILSLILMCFSIVIPQVQQSTVESSTVTVRVADIKNKEGQIGVTVYTTPDGWPDKWREAFRSRLVPIESIPCEIQIPDLPRGTYAVSVIHDENNNAEMDKNLMSMPKEGYGVSNNVKARTFGPPKFSDATFQIGARDTLIVISMKY